MIAIQLLPIISLIVGIVSAVLAVVAIWHSFRSERLSAENYNRTKDLLAQVDKKVAVIEAMTNSTLEKLVDTVTDIARPEKADAETALLTALLPQLLSNPDMIDTLTNLADRQADRQKG